VPHAPALLIGRILLAVIFIVAGFGKLTGGPANFAGWLGSLGFPAPLFFAWATTLLELVGGLFLLVGFQTRLSALALAAFTVAAGLIVHFVPGDQNEMTIFMKNLAIAGGLIVLAATGPGRLSIEGRRG
jgi:putative oxidoreductase